ncbi:MAG: hypothetical protein ACOC3C_04345, partial [Candidatus Thorarchaeota archaeon]
SWTKRTAADSPRSDGGPLWESKNFCLEGRAFLTVILHLKVLIYLEICKICSSPDWFLVFSAYLGLGVLVIMLVYKGIQRYYS